MVLVLVIMVINLRGVKESGVIFAVPTYFFIVLMFVMVALGMGRAVMGSLGGVPGPPPALHAAEMQAVTLFLLLHAFSSGTTALTGVEAISNGITAFNEPRSRNAGLTLIWMSGILGTLFLAMTYLAHAAGAVPSDAETVVSQLARTVFGGRGFFYLAVHRGDHPDPGHGRQHRLRRLSPALRPAGRRRLPAAAAHLSRAAASSTRAGSSPSRSWPRS